MVSGAESGRESPLTLTFSPVVAALGMALGADDDDGTHTELDLAPSIREDRCWESLPPPAGDGSGDSCLLVLPLPAKLPLALPNFDEGPDAAPPLPLPPSDCMLGVACAAEGTLCDGGRVAVFIHGAFLLFIPFT